MIIYLDTSALVKRYVSELGSPEVSSAIQSASVIGSGLIARAEMVAALAKLRRMGVLSSEDAQHYLLRFYGDWQGMVKIGLSDAVVIHAGELAWDYGLRGYDAVHLASALAWRDAMGEPVTMAAFDKRLWQAAQDAGLDVFPADLTPFLLSRP